MSETYDDGAATADAEDTSAADQATDQTLDQGDDQSGDDAAAEAGDEDGDKPKPRRSAQERIDELTRDKREREREVEYWKAKATQSDPKPETRAEPEDADPEPDPADYRYGETDPGYTKELGKWSARQEFARLSQESEQRTQARTVEQSWNERQQAFAKDKADYYDQVNRQDLPITRPMADAIRTSDAGPAVAYHLATNPDEARRIAGLTPLAQIREIGRIEARLETPPRGQIKTASDAPPPPTQVRGQGGRFAISPDTSDFAAFEKLADAKG